MTGISADPYWWQAAPPQDFHIEHWPDRADVVIIGGGYTGFGAAIPLARAGLDVWFLNGIRLGRVRRRVMAALPAAICGCLLTIWPKDLVRKKPQLFTKKPKRHELI